jgi:hypothetical protein
MYGLWPDGGLKNGKEATHGGRDRHQAVEVLVSQGRPTAKAIRTIGVTEVTYYRWRSEYGGLKGCPSSEILRQEAA